MQFTGHVSRVRCIDWFENDLGFTTCGNDGNVYFYDLFKPGQLKDPGKRNTDKDFNKNITISFKRAIFYSIKQNFLKDEDD